jgi:SAM-dependent methyltransferase
MTITSQARSFDTAAAAYAANRPSYPSALLDAIEELTGSPLEGARVADIGAGTGLATMVLQDRGANVIAVEPSPGMASQFLLGLPDVPLVIGDGNHLPLASASIDVLTYAQAWHWTDQRKSVPEALRVLRTGGALALWWNDSDGTVPYAVNNVRPQLEELLFESVENMSVESVDVADAVVRVEARSTARRAVCPGCGCWSSRIHGSYLRFPRDLPTSGKLVVMSFRVRRFVCAEGSCPRKTFAEQVPGLTPSIRSPDGTAAIDAPLGRSRARRTGWRPDGGRLRGQPQPEHPAEA